VRGVVRAWGWWLSGALTVLLALWLYARRYYFELEVPLRDDDEG
jgi:hypothetical protein